MNELLCVRRGEGPDGSERIPRELRWRRRCLLACMALALAVGYPVIGQAVDGVSGEVVGAEGAFRAGACTTDTPDFTISCDDRPQSGVVSCHMRGPTGDEGLAIKTCVDVRAERGGSLTSFLEKDVTIQSSDFGEFFCGKDSDESDFCVVCDTFTSAPGVGTSHCVKIFNNQQTRTGGNCGAFHISNDANGACLTATQDLQQTFSNPQVGFTIGFIGSAAGQPAAKEITLCGRNWQCIPPESLPDDVRQLQQQQTHGLINTPCCISSGTGGTPLCNSKWPRSTTCR